MLDSKNFQIRLAETIQWCTPRVNPYDPKNCLRSSETNPQIGEQYDTKEELDFNKTLFNWQKTTEKLSIKRAELLRLNNSYPEFPFNNLNQGRILLFFPSYVTKDGAVANKTGEFFDWEDVPPWDTWVVFLISENLKNTTDREAFMICWIPNEFKDLADAGIGVSMLESVVWADDLNVNYILPPLKENKLWPILETFLSQI